MTEQEFEKLKAEVHENVALEREKGTSMRHVRCWILGYITARAGNGNERTYTESQLVELFAVTFEKGEDDEGKNEIRT